MYKLSVVVEIGATAEGFKPGDRVASNDPHAEWVVAPQRLCAKIPDWVEFEEAGLYCRMCNWSLQGVSTCLPTKGKYRGHVLEVGICS